MSKKSLKRRCSLKVEGGRKCPTTERPSPDGALGGSLIGEAIPGVWKELESSCKTMGEPWDCGRGGLGGKRRGVRWASTQRGRELRALWGGRQRSQSMPVG